MERLLAAEEFATCIHTAKNSCNSLMSINVCFQRKPRTIYTLKILAVRYFATLISSHVHIQDLAHDDIIDDDQKVNLFKINGRTHA